MACAGSSPSRRAAMTLSEATWNSGANRAKISASAHCAFIWRSIRFTSAGGSGSFFWLPMLAASRRWISGSSTSSSSARVSLCCSASRVSGPGNIHSALAAWIVP